MKFASSKLLFFLCSVFVHLLALTIAQTTLLYRKCVEENGNYTAESTYQTNLNQCLTSLYTNTSIDYGFYYSTYGETSEQVYAIAQCRPDMTPFSCRDCINKTSQELPKNCSNIKEAIGGYEYGGYNYCMLRYANRPIFDLMEPAPYFYVNKKENIKEDVEGFKQARKSLLDRLQSPAASGDSSNKSASGEEPFLNLTIYAYVQCTPDLIQSDCVSCLNATTELLPECCDILQGGRVITPSCNFRYEMTPILMNQAALAPPSTNNAPPPPSTSSTTPPPSTNTAPPPPSTNSTTPPPPSTNTAPPPPSTNNTRPPPPSNNTTPPPPSTNSTRPPPPSTNTIPPPSKKGKNTSRTVIIVISVVIPVIVIICICIYLRARKPKVGTDEIKNVESLQFDLSTIRDATNNFSDANKLGQGGFGAVYKGMLPSGQDIAVKRLSRNSEQGDLEFKNEVLLLARLQHRNLVRLLGFCLERNERLLVYEFLPNKSFDRFIFDPIERECMNWERRHKIIGGIARGLLYLHENSRLRIIHRDLKASNILLDSDMNPKISDFGMARLFEMDETQGDTDIIVGTRGYMAPEYVLRGHYSVKSDVFSFGVLVLEIVSGQKRRCFRIGEVDEDLLTFAWENWNEGTALTLVDPTLGASSRSEILRCIHIALLCFQENVADRPTMASVVAMLSSYFLTLPVPSKPAFFIHGSVIGSVMPETSSSSSSPLENNSRMRLIQSDQSKRESAQWSKNEVSITELYPR